MQVAYELGIDDEVVLAWSETKFARWVAFINIAAERSKRKPGQN
jgi:hypothetical protein